MLRISSLYNQSFNAEVPVFTYDDITHVPPRWHEAIKALDAAADPMGVAVLGGIGTRNSTSTKDCPWYKLFIR